MHDEITSQRRGNVWRETLPVPDLYQGKVMPIGVLDNDIRPNANRLHGHLLPSGAPIPEHPASN
jgi:hypothetical protein